MSSFVSLVLFALLSIVSGQKYSFYNDPIAPYVQVDQTHRFMLTKPPKCQLAGSRYVCTVETQHGSVDSNGTEAFATVVADLNCAFSSDAQVDFRRAQECSCQATVTKGTDPPKQCACTLCPSGYGDNPINVDCDKPNATDPFVLEPCTSFDCRDRCNGTCSFGCAEPIAEECRDLCTAVEPTMAPTGYVEPPSGVTPAVTAGFSLAAAVAGYAWLVVF